MRLGFVGELAYELHFPASHSDHLWNAILEAGAEWDIRPFGLMAQRLLRLEKGHIIVSQDTDFETTPWKIGMQLGREARQARLRRQGRPAARPAARRPRAARAVDAAEGHRVPARGLDGDGRRASSPAASRRPGTPRRSATRSGSPGCTAPTPPPARGSSSAARPAPSSAATPSTTRRERSSVPDLFTVHDAAKVRCFAPAEALDALATPAGALRGRIAPNEVVFVAAPGRADAAARRARGRARSARQRAPSSSTTPTAGRSSRSAGEGADDVFAPGLDDRRCPSRRPSSWAASATSPRRRSVAATGST